ncbi:MAG: hypothetical protein H3C38_04965 [Rhodospirillales bacterium]|nr:hypothetical protein [Rhodospirillales bacterium]
MPKNPLYCPRKGSKTFEVRLYNKDVRALLKANLEHELFDAKWADETCQIVEAQDAAEARILAARRYPPEKGFVISKVSMVSSP